MRSSIVGLKELREDFGAYIAEVQKGRSFTVVRRSKPVLRISSPTEESVWEPVIDFTTIRKGGVAIGDVLSCL